MKYVKTFNGPARTEYAIQLLPEDVSPSDEYQEELEFVLDDIQWHSGRDGSVDITQTIGVVTDTFQVPPNHWIIRDDFGIISELSPEEFEKAYQ